MVKAKISFNDNLQKHGLQVRRDSIGTLQVNIGKRCNQACSHCHVEAGPKHTENMKRETVSRLLKLLQKSDVHTVDITGGAPELNPNFRYFVEQVRSMGKQVIDRCNLTVLFEEGQEDTAEFLAQNQVQIVASLPCYTADNVDEQRGKGVFGKSIDALHMLNKLGYGQEGSGLLLHLVYNPNGAFLPPSQQQLQADYKEKLKNDLDIVFNDLYTITNMPIKRYAHYLKREGKLEEYMDLLLNNFNPAAVESLMCKGMLSIGWDGQIFDCDFNQMLYIPVAWQPKNIWDIDDFAQMSGDVALDDHCYGCTAGAGSSCGGALS